MSDDHGKLLDDLGDLEWDSALDEWEKNTFVPEVARDAETNQVAPPVEPGEEQARDRLRAAGTAAAIMSSVTPSAGCLSTWLNSGPPILGLAGHGRQNRIASQGDFLFRFALLTNLRLAGGHPTWRATAQMRERNGLPASDDVISSSSSLRSADDDRTSSASSQLAPVGHDRPFAVSVESAETDCGPHGRLT